MRRSMQLTVRRPVLVTSLGVAALLAAVPAATAASPSAPEQGRGQEHASAPSVPADSLRALASDVGLHIGTAVNAEQLAQNPRYREIVADQFSTVTPENAMKWEALEPRRGEYDWAQADQLVEFAQENDQLVRGHTLVWHNQLPAWLNEAAPDMTPEELRAVLRQHIFDVVRHFRGDIWQWDVVNEAVDDNGELRDSIWLQKLGPGYIADAFRWAHQADPKALLFYNDYNVAYTGAKSERIYQLVKELQAQGVPIHGVGFQTHLSTQYGFPQLRENLQRFADLGLYVAETEVDVRTEVQEGTNTPTSNAGALAQDAEYSQSLQACLQVRRCISYTVWGIGDHLSWVPGTFPGTGAATIYDEDLQPKSSYDVLQQDLELASGAPVRPGRWGHWGRWL